SRRRAARRARRPRVEEVGGPAGGAARRDGGGGGGGRGPVAPADGHHRLAAAQLQAGRGVGADRGGRPAVVRRVGPQGGDERRTGRTGVQQPTRAAATRSAAGAATSRARSAAEPTPTTEATRSPGGGAARVTTPDAAPA